MQTQNIYAALRGAFPADLDAPAIELVDGEPQFYTWRDIDRATAMLANWLASLDLPAGARIAAHVDKSVEALLLYLAVLRGGWVYLPVNNAYQRGELEHFIRDAEPSVLVCASKNFGWVSKLAFTSGVPHVFTLNDDRTGTLLDRASFQSDQHAPVLQAADDLAAMVDTSGTTGRSKDLIINGGCNVYPVEGEGAINDLPGVQECEVVDVPHADLDEDVLAMVVPTPGASIEPGHLIAALRTHLAAFKVPKQVVVVV
jgi:malonyl-CoA/methylmalonyl-CoA synthetase